MYKTIFLSFVSFISSNTCIGIILEIFYATIIFAKKAGLRKFSLFSKVFYLLLIFKILNPKGVFWSKVYKSLIFLQYLNLRSSQILVFLWQA